MKKIPLLLLFLGHVWVDASQAILPVVLVKLKELFSLSYFQVGFVMAVLNLTSSVIQPVFGYISDRFSTGWFVPIGILWTALTMGLLGWSANYPVAVLFTHESPLCSLLVEPLFRCLSVRHCPLFGYESFAQETPTPGWHRLGALKHADKAKEGRGFVCLTCLQLVASIQSTVRSKKL